jgi:hypothetical protein
MRFWELDVIANLLTVLLQLSFASENQSNFLVAIRRDSGTWMWIYSSEPSCHAASTLFASENQSNFLVAIRSDSGTWM